MSKFYMVFLEGTTSPTFKHPSQLAAEQEAQRLVERTQRTAYILESKSKIELAPKFIKEELS